MTWEKKEEHGRDARATERKKDGEKIGRAKKKTAPAGGRREPSRGGGIGSVRCLDANLCKESRGS
jgi:hypothetical protein